MIDEILAIETLLNLHVGYGFEFFGGLLSLRELEDKTFIVEREKFATQPNEFELEWSVSLKDAHEAAELFVNKRNELEIGLDFEKETSFCDYDEEDSLSW